MIKDFQKTKSIAKILLGCVTSQGIDMACVFTLLVFLAFTQYSYAVGINARPVNNAGGDTLNSGLVGWWTFDGEDLVSNVADKSGNGNTGYMVNMATSSAKVVGKLGQALKFDGVDDYVKIGNLGNVKTISYWIKTGTSGRYTMNMYDGTTDNSYVYNNSIPMGMSNVTTYIDGIATNQLGSELIVNGNFDSNITGWTAGWASTISWQNSSSGDGSTGFLRFSIASNANWDRFRSDSNVTTANKMYVNSMWYKTFGITGSSLLQPASTDNYNYMTNSAYGKYITASASWKYFSTPIVTASNQYPIFTIHKEANIGAGGFDVDAISVKEITSNIANNKWRHVVITSTDNIVATNLVLGRVGGSYFLGSIDDVRIYNRALSASEIKQLYNEGGVKLNTQPTNAGGDTLKSGLVGWWTFDGADIVNNVVDKSGNGNTGYMVNMATSSAKVAGKLGQALKFDGVDDYITGTNLGFSGDVTVSVSAWVKFLGDNSGNFPAVIDLTSTSGTDRGLIFTVKDNKPSFDFYINRFRATSSLSKYVWYHVVLIKTPGLISNTTKIYVNGVEVAGAVEGSDSTPNVTAGSFNIGRRPTSDYFNGVTDDIRVYNRALSASEIKQLYNEGGVKLNTQPTNAGGDTLKSGLVGWWTFDGADIVNNVVDKSGNGNTGYMQGFTSTSSAKVAGKLGQALKFDGVNDYVDLGNGSSLNNISSRTISFWLYNNKYFATDPVGSHYLNKGDKTFFASDPSNSRYIFGQNFSTAVGRWSIPMSAIGLNRWYHILIVYDRSSSSNDPTWYVNGVAQVVTEYLTPSGTAVDDSADKLVIGRSLVYGRWIDVKIDDVRIYNRALSASEVKQLYNMGR